MAQHPAISSRVLNSDRGSMALVTNTTPEEPEATRNTVQNHLCNLPSITSRHVGLSSKIPGFSIISRFPNSKNAEKVQGHDLTLDNHQAHSDHVLQDFQHCNTRSHGYSCTATSATANPLSTLSTSAAATAACSSATVDSTTSQGLQPVLEAYRQYRNAPTDNYNLQDIQCNVVTSSSSDDEDSDQENVRRPVRRNQHLRQGSQRSSSQHLSRELNNLQLDSPSFKPSRPRTRRSRADEGRQLRSAKKSSSIPMTLRRQCDQISARIRGLEKKVSQKTLKLLADGKASSSGASRAKNSSDACSPRLLRSSQCSGDGSSPLTSPCISTRALRPRTPNVSHRVGPVGRKRKRLENGDEVSLDASPRKSPKPSSSKPSSSVHISKPVVTRSRTAKVLQLKN